MKKTIVIVAHEISASAGSECAEGWNIACQLSKFELYDFVFLCAKGPQLGCSEYQASIKAALPKNTSGSVEFFFVEPGKLYDFVSNLNKRFIKLGPIGIPLLYYLGYALWHKKSLKALKSLAKKRDVAAIHLLTQITFRQPGEYYKLDIPFVWGPTGGTEIVPFEFLKSLPLKMRISELLRIPYFKLLSNGIRVRKATQKANKIFAFTPTDKEYFEKRASDVEVMLDAACTKQATGRVRKLKDDEKLKCVWAGHLIARKLPDIALNVFVEFPNLREKVELVFLGDGPLRSKLESIKARQNLYNVNFLGMVEHREMSRFLLEAHVLLHTSFREAGTHIIPEAFSLGLPAITHHCSGMAYSVPGRGLTIPLISVDNSVKDFGNALQRLVEERDLVETFSKNSLKFAEVNDWSGMANRFVQTYDKIVQTDGRI